MSIGRVAWVGAKVNNQDPGPLLERGLVIGHVDEVNGKGAKEMSGFVPTRHELLELARHWLEKVLKISYSWFITAQTGSREIRLEPYAMGRVSRIAALVGQEAVREIEDEVFAEFQQKVDPRHWDIFLRGDKKQREEVREEFYREIAREHTEEGIDSHDSD